MVRASYSRRLLVRVAGVLTLTLAVLQPGPAGAQTTPGGPDFRISAGTSIRLDGQGPTTFGDQIGLDFRGGVMRAAWADNSGSPDLDLATAAIAVSGGGSPSVGSTVPVRVADDQTGASLAIDPSVAGRVLGAARTGSYLRRERRHPPSAQLRTAAAPG